MEVEIGVGEAGAEGIDLAAEPRQRWCWDMTYLPAQATGRWFFLFLILDLYSRKIVGWEVRDIDHAESLFRTAKYRPEFPTKGFADPDQARAWAAGFVHWYNFAHRHSGIRYVSPAQRQAGDDHAILSARHMVSQSARVQPCAMVWPHPELSANRRRYPQPRTRHHHKDAFGCLHYSTVGCMAEATTTLTCAGFVQVNHHELDDRSKPCFSDSYHGGEDSIFLFFATSRG